VELSTAASPFWRGAVACTGTEFCKLAITETKDFTRWLVTELDERLPEFSQEFRLNVTGCPNACGQHWIADIGIEGKKVKQDGAMVDAYYFCVGGSVGEFAAIARPVGYRCAASEVPDAIERLLRNYQAARAPEENLRRFLARHTNVQIRELLAADLRRNTPAMYLRGQCRTESKGDARRTISEIAAIPDVFSVGGKNLLGRGCGRCSEEKIRGLLASGASVRVIAPSATAAISLLAREKKLSWLRRKFHPRDLSRMFLVVAATSSAEVHEVVWRAARRANVLCNVVDDPER